jgi:hypothetical protein
MVSTLGIITIPQNRRESVKLAAEKAVNKTWGRVKAIWDATPNVLKWTIGFTGLFIGGFIYGYVVAYAVATILLALGLSAGVVYVLSLAITLGSFYGLLFWALSLMDEV